LPKRSLVALLALGAAALAVAEPAATVDAARIPAYHRVSPALVAAGQPSPEGLASLKDLGFRTVVNLRPPAEGPADEAAVVQGEGLRYVNVPVTAGTFSAADVDAVEKVLQDPSAAPVLLHCASSNRVGAVIAVLEARHGKSLDEALSAGRAAGLHSPVMEDAVRRVLGVPAPPLPATAPAASVPPAHP
jgi:uncharacterized protein (TIGR01244 family)